MRAGVGCLAAVMVGTYLFVDAGPSLGQARALAPPECQALRGRLAEHAKLSEGVRRALASQVARYPAAPSTAPQPSRAVSGRAARLEQIAQERQQLEEQRLGALVKFDLSRVSQLQKQIDALDAEKSAVEKQPAEAPGGASAPAPAQPSQQVAGDADRIPCGEMSAAYDAAIKTRRRELGAREEQAGVVPLTSLKGQSQEQIARELAAQFAAWPEAATQVGLLDQDGNGQIDSFADVPARDLFRVYRQRSDGTLAIEVFPLPGRATDTSYDEMTRRLDEAIARQAGRQLSDLLASHPAGPVRVVAETADFGVAYAQFLAGNYVEAARVQSAAARSSELQNFRGETCRLVEILIPTPGGVVMRRVVIMPRPNNQEMWEETLLTVRPASYWRTDAEMVTGRQTRTTTGTLVGTPVASTPVKFSVER